MQKELMAKLRQTEKLDQNLNILLKRLKIALIAQFLFKERLV